MGTELETTSDAETEACRRGGESERAETPSGGAERDEQKPNGRIIGHCEKWECAL